MYCSDCFQKSSLDEVGYDIWEGGEERQFICSCDRGKLIRSIVFNWETWDVEYYGIYKRTEGMENE